MRITIALPDKIAERVCRLPDRDEFVARAVEAALAREQQETIPTGTKPSKWVRLVEQIERQSGTSKVTPKNWSATGKTSAEAFASPHDET